MQKKRFDNFPPDWGMLRRFRCVQIFLKTFQCKKIPTEVLENN